MSPGNRSSRLVLAGGIAFAAALAFGAAAGAFGPPQFVVEDAARPRVLHRERVVAGATFSLEYVHSSERVPVRGTFRVEPDGSLAVVETAFAGFGPGLPELVPGDDWRIAHGRIVHRPRNTALSELRLRVSEIARQRLTTPSGTTIDLATRAGHGALVIIRIHHDRPPS